MGGRGGASRSRSGPARRAREVCGGAPAVVPGGEAAVQGENGDADTQLRGLLLQEGEEGPSGRSRLDATLRRSFS